jgi:glycosyltransferase involved in cell wall biosynthesis
MNILELNFERTWRGGERQTIYNMQGFRDAGHNVVLLCRKGYPLEVKARAEGFEVKAFKNIFGVILYLMFSGRKYKVLHAQTSHILTYCVFTKPFHRAKIIFTRRVDFVPRGGMTRLKYRLADTLVGVSTAVKKIVETFANKPVTVIPDIAEAKDLDKSRAETFLKEQSIGADKHILGTTAALVPHKDPLTMVEAIKALSKIRSDFVFLHFGTGDLDDAVRQKINEYGLNNVYRQLGFHENVEDFFTVFEVFVMSSEEEGLGSSVLDAFLYKVPVVSTDAGGLADLIADGRGILCRKHAPQMIADGIDLVLKQETFDKEMTSRAYDYVKKYHSVAHITQQYLALLR